MENKLQRIEKRKLMAILGADKLTSIYFCYYIINCFDLDRLGMFFDDVIVKRHKLDKRNGEDSVMEAKRNGRLIADMYLRQFKDIKRSTFDIEQFFKSGVADLIIIKACY